MARTQIMMRRFETTRIAAAIAMAFASQIALATPPAPTTLPTGGQVVAGQASIQQAGANMTIRQATSQAILNWQSFSIGSGAAVNFIQPSASAVALNRVLGSDPSAIYGSLTANGQVFLVNPSGVLFGPGARVDVGGLVASTLNIRDADFLARNYRFTRDGTTGAVVNQTALSGQYVALLAPEVRNEGVIAARMGTIALAAGDAVTLGISGQRLVDVQVDRASIDTLVANRQLVRAEEGTVILSAQSAHTLLGRVVNSGAIEANGISTDGGTVRLLASSTVEHSGSISADGATNGSGGSAILLADLSNPASRTLVSGSLSARGGSQSGDGGFIETSASRLSIADSARIDTSAPNGRTGLWLLDPVNFTIALAGGDMTGAALGTALATTDVTIDTDAGAGGDIFVNASVTWGSAKTLTLNADRNIYINSEISVNGAGTLLLNYDMGSIGGDYFVRAPINLSATATFMTENPADGQITYTVIRDNAGLTNIAGNLAGDYVLGTNITVTTNPWVPLGDNTTSFTGRFDGLGHTVNGVTHANAANDTEVGFFGRVGAGADIRNVGVTNVNIAGAINVGALAGVNAGVIRNSYSSGTVVGSDVVGANNDSNVGSVGGLVGRNDGNITSSYSSASVTATTGIQGGGGSMVPNFMQGGIGGLAGASQSPINSSYATGAVTGISDVGGLVGYNMGAINTGYSTGAVTGTNTRGGLVGFLNVPMFAPPMLTSTYWDTTTSGQATSAQNGPDMSTGLITADMKQSANLTGLDFTDTWVIRENNSYPLLRSMLPPIFVKPNDQTKVYDGAVFGGAHALTFSTPTNAKVNAGGAAFGGTAAAGVNAGAYAISVTGITLASDTDQHGFLSVNPIAGALAVTPKPVTLTAPAATKPYDGATTYTATAGELTALSALLGVGADTVTGITLIYTGAAAGAGNKVLTPSAATVSSAAGNYTITYTANNTASITPKAVTLTPQAATKVFDGTTNYAATAGDLAVLSALLGVGGETVTGVTLTYDTAAVGVGKTLTPSAATVSSAAGNYNITYTANATSAITAVPVVVPVTAALQLPLQTNVADNVVRDFSGGNGSAASLLAGAGVGLRVFDSAAFSLASDLIIEIEEQGSSPNSEAEPSRRRAAPRSSAGRSNVFPPGGLVAVRTSTNRSSNTLASADAFTNHSGYQVRVPAGGDSSQSTLSSIPQAGSLTIASGRSLEFVLPNNAFSHTRPDAVVTLSARQANGQPLPSWLKFDSQTGKFSGTPPAGFSGALAITVTARDSGGKRATTSVSLSSS